MQKKNPVDRLNYSGNLDPVIRRICDAYKIGKLISFSVIESGYEDCNVIVNTDGGKFVAKIFSKIRSKENIARYVTIIEKAIEAGVCHPLLIKTDSDNAVYTDNEANGISLILMKFIEGKPFIELNRIPDADELKMIIEQAVRINRIDYHPSYLFDSWAIPNIKTTLEKVEKFISPEDLRLIKLAAAEYFKIPIDKLPHCFVHGDFTKTNVFKGNDGKIYILDFSVLRTLCKMTSACEDKITI
ncbi:MAG: phosphotransferase [Patescibacteria group bacterium]|nr:phosphotransferase [Patescibacteria group bacterium]